MTWPRATYRLQFHKDFTFADAARQAGYFAALGVSHIYASPILTARAGSQHGYDVIDHDRINPELGGEDGFRSLIQILRRHELGLIADIVPNHMAVGGNDNRWWLDVLQKGRDSAFARMFDIDWQAPGLEGKILAPFLDGTPRAAWESRALTLQRDPQLGPWTFACQAHRFPLRPEDQQLETPPTNWDEAAALLARQHFVLADWREADSRINWRRFFDITDLAALRMEDPAVFDAVHRKILALYDEGLIDGIRVDHVDGLADPAAYCRTLRQRLTALRPRPYLVVEKILAEGEVLPASWDVDGTTGYDLMNDISALQHADDGGALERQWQAISGWQSGFDAEETACRRAVLEEKFAAQRDGACRAILHALPHLPPDAARPQMMAMIEALRCYRDYQTGLPDSPAPGPILTRALARAPGLSPLFHDRRGIKPVMEALRHFNQLCAPVAAKAVEDTALYRYGRLLSRNDVGFEPRRAWLAPADFHGRIAARARHWPHALLATATHDHKRGEDVRARLAVLSALPELWETFVRRAPRDAQLHPADLYILYQTLLGTWPAAPDAAFADRIALWGRKQLREARQRSSWQSPDEDYEGRFCAFARRLVLADDGTPFRADIAALLQAIQPMAENNSLVQTVLRNTLPGVPDIYQGTEFTDRSLVDPDNRRAVDYAARDIALTRPLTPQSSLDDRKQRLIQRLLTVRRAQPLLWEQSDYHPVPQPAGFIAFTRHHDGCRLFVLARCNGAAAEAMLDLPWHGRDLLTGRRMEAGMHASSRLLEHWPALVLYALPQDSVLAPPCLA